MGRPGIAALLSALIPGLGQARLGAGRRGMLIALPFVGLLVAGAAALILDPKAALDTLLSAGVLVILLVLVIVLAVYHLAAIVDAFRLGNRLGATQDPPVVRRRALGSPLLLVALAGVIGFYGVIEYVGVRAYQVSRAVFVNPDTGFQIPAASFSPRPSPTSGQVPTGPVTAPPPPSPTPIPVPAWEADGRRNLLLIGSDAGPGRWMVRTDTMIVLSVDVGSGRAALFGVPRNMVNVPLPPESAAAFKGGVLPQFLNALYVYAMQHPSKFPGGEARGFRAVLAARVDAHDIQTIQFSPPRYPEYLNAKAVQKIRDRVATVFDEPAASSPTPDSPKPCPRK